MNIATLQRIATYTVVVLQRIAVYTALTFLATVLLCVETPATGGYFNLGEAAIYVVACISTPIVAAIASGLGPALADLALGYWYFAPATLAIKFCEGFVVSYLARRLPRRGSPMASAITAIVGASLAVVVATKTSLTTASASVVLTWTPTRIMGIEIPIPSVSISLPSIIWIAIASMIVIISVLAAIVASEKPLILAMACGGVIMVTGYFLYEFFVSNPLILHRDPMGALFEVPVNVGQFTTGIVIAYPVVRFLERAGAIRRESIGAS